MRALSWERRQRVNDIVRGVGGHAGRAAVGGLTRIMGSPRLAAWSVESTKDRHATVSEVTEELSPYGPVTPAEIVGNYVRGYVLLGRGGSTRPEPIFRRLDPRAVIDSSTSHVPSRVRAYVRQSDLQFGDTVPLRPVIDACRERERTWIVEPVVEAFVEPVVEAFVEAERAGVVSTWTGSRDGELVAGMFGVVVGRVFGIVSMFHREDRSGSVVMASLLTQLSDRWDLIDCGSPTANFSRYGARELGADEFSARVLESVVSGRSGSAAGGAA